MNATVEISYLLERLRDACRASDAMRIILYANAILSAVGAAECPASRRANAALVYARRLRGKNSHLAGVEARWKALAPDERREFLGRLCSAAGSIDSKASNILGDK